MQWVNIKSVIELVFQSWFNVLGTRSVLIPDRIDVGLVHANILTYHMLEHAADFFLLRFKYTECWTAHIVVYGADMKGLLDVY